MKLYIADGACQDCGFAETSFAKKTRRRRHVRRRSDLSISFLLVLLTCFLFPSILRGEMNIPWCLLLGFDFGLVATLHRVNWINDGMRQPGNYGARGGAEIEIELYNLLCAQ
ncbi:hypothetical protein V8C37DRAFT_363641 [Trichoderma ceciliae]